MCDKPISLYNCSFYFNEVYGNKYTNQVVYLNDEEIAVLDRNEGLKITNIAQQQKTPYIQELELQIEALEKGGYEHFMLKEIFEQPRSIHDCFRGRLNAEALANIYIILVTFDVSHEPIS